MNCNKLLYGIIAVFTLLSCTEKPYDSSVNDYGTVALSVTAPEGVTECIVFVPGIDTLAVLNGAVHQIQVPASTFVRVVAYAGHEAVICDGTTVTMPESGAPKTFYSASCEINVRPSAVTDVTLELVQRIRQLEIAVSDMSAPAAVCIDNAAQSLECEYNRFFAPAARLLSFDGEKNSEKLDILGFAGDCLSLTYTSGAGQKDERSYMFSVPMSRIGGNISSPLGITISAGSAVPSASVHTGEHDVEMDIYIPPVVYTYKAGDYYPVPDVDLSDPAAVSAVEGIVFSVDETGEHGKVIGLKEGSGLKWNISGGADNTDDIHDGMKNLETVLKNDPSLDNHPAFAWCVALGDGWYIPALEELREIRTVWGATQDEKDVFNKKFTDIGADPLYARKYVEAKGSEQAAYYYTSTEAPSARNKIWSFSFNSTGDATSALKKSSDTQENLLFRAIKKF